jgi:hypothetical protein
VVDGHALGSNVSTACAKVANGATGIAVLHAAGHSVGFRSDGLVCTIDGLPKAGCASVDDSHYWAYFHRAPGKTAWTYSTEGPSTYQPANDSTEGWVYDDGTALTPANVPYAQVCKTEASPTPTPSPSHKASHRPRPSPRRSHHPRPAPTSAGASAPTTTPTGSKPPHAHRRHTARPRNGHSDSAHNSQEITTTFPTPSATAAALVGGNRPPSNHHGLLGLVIGLLAVAGLGGFAVARFRRSPP